MSWPEAFNLNSPEEQVGGSVIVAGRGEAFERVHKLICDLNEDRYGRPLIAALHLCLELADELSARSPRTASEPNKQEPTAI